jgi:6-phosphogluconolactonase (cycloisomerase 2 family)
MPPRRGRFVLGATVALAFLGVPAAGAMADPGALYTQTNDPAGNLVQAFDRDAHGRLTPAGTFSTGGTGLAALGGRQGAVELSDDESTVYAVNAGSNSVSAFGVGRDGLALEDVAASGGIAPDSVDEHRGRVYVLNSGGTPNVTAFRARRDGSLEPFASRDLPGALGAAQVTVSPDGSALVVSERLSNRLETLPLDRLGRPGAPVVTASSGAVPFGFGISPQGTIVVSEAGASTVSSYRLDRDGALRSVTGSLAVGQGAACWVAVSPNGRLAYTGNAAGGIGGFAIAGDGSLTAIGTTLLAPSPRDLDFDATGRYLHAVSSGGQVTVYRVSDDGSLTVSDTAPAAAGITGAAAL